MQVREDEIYRNLASLNDELERGGDLARVRFASIETDPDFEGEWLVLVTWELPDPASSDLRWPLEQLDRYCELVADRLADCGASTECLFRTESELRSDAGLGVPVSESAA